LGMDVEVYRLHWPFKSYPDPREYDLIGIGYPIHAFNTPKVVLDFFKKFPEENRKRFFIFKTSGEPLSMNDSSSRKLIHLLKRKGYECIHEFHYIMPYNMVFRHSDGMAKKMWFYAQKMADLNCYKIRHNLTKSPQFRPLQGWYIVPFRIEWPFTKTNGRHFKVNYDLCVHCHKCMNVCPMDNITEEGKKLVFGNRCVLCMACSFHCPKRAITPGMFRHKWLINGSYHLEALEKDEKVVMPKKSHEKKFNRSYDQYFAMCDRLLQETVRE
jgi:ferredoxin